jgi:hypothetical protein
MLVIPTPFIPLPNGWFQRYPACLLLVRVKCLDEQFSAPSYNKIDKKGMKV